METAVLIPKELSLALTSVQQLNYNKSNSYRRDSRFRSNVWISVWSNVFIPSGTLIYPFEGSIRFDNIDLYSLLDDNDVSTTVSLTALYRLHVFRYVSYSLNTIFQNICTLYTL